MIFLIRHGQTEFNVQRRLQGRMDSPLTPLGIEQAQRMGRVLGAFAEAPERWRVVSSPLGRTLRTAEIVCRTMGLGCRIETDPRLAEIHIGDWEGLSQEEVESNAPGAGSGAGWFFNAPGGETYEDVAERVRAFLADQDEADGTLRLLVAHGLSGSILREVYAGVAHDWARPPQDAVFRLWKGVVGRVDEGVDA
ncbi:MAG TPA: histidine phosphatase family protein [Caulobacteraceae bacterium]